MGGGYGLFVNASIDRTQCTGSGVWILRDSYDDLSTNDFDATMTLPDDNSMSVLIPEAGGFTFSEKRSPKYGTCLARLGHGVAGKL